MYSWRLLLISALMGVASWACADLSMHTLDNGLRVVIKPDHRVPAVMNQVWYHVGSADEQFGKTGLAHMLEHMMFQGTDKYPHGAYSEIIQTHGGMENAFTSADNTVYFAYVLKEQWPQVLDLEADRMRHVSCSGERFGRERDVVKEERYMRVDDRPTSQFYERFKTVVHPTGPYHHPVIGWMDDIEHYTSDDCQQWHDQWYAPNHATLIVIGDVDPESALEEIKQHFSELKAKTPPARHITHTRLEMAREVLVTLPSAEPALVVAYNVPSVVTAPDPQDAFALLVLAEYLAGDDDSLLQTYLVRGQEVAANVSAHYDILSRFDDMLTISVYPVPGQEMFALRFALIEMLEGVKTELIDEDHLNRIKRRAKASHVFTQDSVFQQANWIGTILGVGLPLSWQDSYLDEIDKVTPEQVREVAMRYLIPERQTLGVLEGKQDD